MVARMGRFEHGGDVYAADGTHAGVVDFSSNLNPLGIPDDVADALRKAIPSFDAYPDPQNRALRTAIAAHHGVPAEWVVCAAGASDTIERLCQTVRPESAVVTAPCFSGYEQALGRVGARIVRVPLRESDNFAFRASDWRLHAGAEVPPPRLGFLCNPNNPTGVAVERAELMAVLEEAHRMEMIVALDESFLDFTDEPSAVGLCARYPNLVVIRAFTKLYAMAGLRLGYGICADADLARQLREACQPWAVSTPATVAGLAALSIPGWASRTRAYVSHERSMLADGLARLGLRVVPSVANYLLFQCATPLYEPLLNQGILIRPCGNYEGLDDSWYRVAVRSAEDNAALLGALEGILAHIPEVLA